MMATEWRPTLTRAERRAANKAAWAVKPVKSRTDCQERAAAWREVRARHRDERKLSKSDAPLPEAFRKSEGVSR